MSGIARLAYELQQMRIEFERENDLAAQKSGDPEAYYARQEEGRAEYERIKELGEQIAQDWSRYPKIVRNYSTDEVKVI